MPTWSRSCAARRRRPDGRPGAGGRTLDRLQDKIALVTGAARGIGEAIAEAFAAEGAHVLVTDIADEAGRAVAARLGARSLYEHLDVRVEADWITATGRTLATWGRLDIVVNNAGITGFEAGVVAHDPEHADLAGWREVMRTNLEGVFLGCKHAIRAMRRTGRGSIINLSSRSGIVGIPGAAAYAASKAAVRNHTKSVALYCAEQGLLIRCNSLHPAAILTPMWEPLLGDGPEREERLQAFVSDTPAGRFGQPAEVAAVAVLLASDEATYITGAEIHIDGGILAGTWTPPPDASRGPSGGAR